MPRIARVIVPGYPHHVTQRGNNRATVFFDDEDRQTYLDILTRYSRRHDLQLWAYCLMDNHLHLLAVPDTEASLSRGVGLTNQVYTQYLNRKLGQSGRIWQNRFFSCVVENATYLWAAARYIERNPLKAGLAQNPEAYRWSSARAHLVGAEDEILGSTSWLDPAERSAYAAFVSVENDEVDDAIRRATRTGRPLGSETFMGSMESRLKQTLRPKKIGRPKKKPEK